MLHSLRWYLLICKRYGFAQIIFALVVLLALYISLTFVNCRIYNLCSPCLSLQFVGDKVGFALSQGLKVIACVGETLEQRESGSTLAVVAAQTQAIAGTSLAIRKREKKSLLPDFNIDMAFYFG